MLFGWFLFMLLAIWGSWNRDVGIVVFLIGVFICFMGSLSFLSLLNNNTFWRTQEELEEIIKQEKDLSNKYLMAADKLTRAALKFEEKEHNI